MNRAEQYFRQIIPRGELGHAYLIESERAEAGLETARSLARLASCEQGTGCGICPSCRAFDSGNHPDILTLTKAKEAYSIAEVRDQLIDDIQIKPYRFLRKIYILPAAESLNPASQNALLKTLEEPPAYGLIILTTTNRNALLPTVLSRLVCLNADEEGGEETDGVPKEAEQALLDLLKRMEFARAAEMNTLSARLKEQGMPPGDQLNLWELFLRDLYLVKAGTETALRFPEERRTLRGYAERLTDRQLAFLWDSLAEAKIRLKANVNPDMIIEVLCLRFRQILTEREE